MIFALSYTRCTGLYAQRGMGLQENRNNMALLWGSLVSSLPLKSCGSYC
ncbi:hypothetical protein EP837_00523 [Sphingobium sp. EP60837]|jgi:hypothetical protein|nr:hypothetical protein EP837_00523 [Sphingobium sp. EP60837]